MLTPHSLQALVGGAWMIENTVQDRARRARLFIRSGVVMGACKWVDVWFGKIWMTRGNKLVGEREGKNRAIRLTMG